MGLAIGTKWLALGTLAIYSIVFGPQIIFPAILVASPWFYLAYRFTGNPIYPLFSGLTDNSFSGIGSAFQHVLLTPWYLTKPFDDFVSPLVGLVFILAIISLKQKNNIAGKIAVVGILGSILTMILVPPSTRYFLPYFPALIVSVIVYLSTIKNAIYQKITFWAVILSGFLILGLRLLAMQKYIPFLLGRVDTNTLLTSQYFRLPGIFIDADGFVASLPKDSKIIVDKLHNLYYFPRDFDHTSWVTNFSGYDYLVTIGEDSGNIKGVLVNTNKLGIQIFKLTK